MMSILKSLFESKKEEPQKPNLDALLQSPDSNGSIIELDNYICKLCAWGKHLEKLSEPQRVFYLNQELEREVNSGGFESFFYNSYGTFANDTISTLKTVGAIQFADILQQAIGVFPNGQVPKDIGERQRIMDCFAEDAWEQFDYMFQTYPENLNDLNLDYVRKHRESF